MRQPIRTLAREHSSQQIATSVNSAVELADEPLIAGTNQLR